MTTYLGHSFVKPLQDVGFNDGWVCNIMSCVETTKLTILWNGEKIDWITPNRGIRQWDAISLYLFILCIKRLSHMIH